MPARPEAQGRAPLRAIPRQDECGEHALTDAVSLKLQRVLAPMHKRALGVATGLTAAAGVFGSGEAWPDLVVATIMAALGVSGGWQIVRRAGAELRESPPPARMAGPTPAQ